jgi:hypothetical protein
MAEKSLARGAGGQLTWLWMLLALVMIGGFLAWLSVTAEPTSVAVAERSSSDDSGGPTLRVSLAQLSNNPLAFQGQHVEVAEVAVASRVGDRLFWTQFPNNTPFLTKLNDALVGQGVTVRSGEVLTVTGRILPMSDSIMNAWKADGTLQTPDQQMEAEFATSFLEVDAVHVAGPGRPGASE